MRRVMVLALAIAGCSRSFPEPPKPAVQLHGLALDGQPLPDDAAVVAVRPGGTHARLSILGAHLETTQAVLVGGQLATGLAVAEDTVSFDAPRPEASTIAQTVIVTVRAGGGTERTAGRIRLYVAPTLDTIPPPVNAPGDVVLRGSGFSPVASEDVVTVAGSAPIPVTLAAPDHLVLTLPDTLPEGRQILTVEVVPTGSTSLGLVAQRRPLIWKKIPAFWNDPPQAFVGTEVRFRTATDAGTLYEQLDRALALQTANGTLDVPIENASTLGQTTGTTGGGTGTSGGTSGGGTAAGVVVDAGDLSANYPPDDGSGDSVPGSTPSHPRSAPTSSSVPAHEGLSVARDGIDTGARPLIETPSNQLSWIVADDTPAGSHAIALLDPAGSSQYASLAVLAGHLPAPGITCASTKQPYPQLSARGLHSRDVQGDVVLSASNPDGTIELVIVHPGGAAERRTVGPFGEFVGAAQVLAAGRDLLYLSGTGNFGPVVSAHPYDLPDQLEFQAELAPTKPMGVVEPNGRSLNTWVTGADGAGSLASWSHGEVSFDPASVPGSCVVASVAAGPTGVVLGATCVNPHKVALGLAPLPTTAEDLPAAPTWSTFTFGTGAVQELQAFVLPGDGELLVRTRIPDGGTAISAVRADPAGATSEQIAAPDALDPPLASALSPDGTQALVGRAGSVEIFNRDALGTWHTGGSLPLPGNATQIGFDAAGTHAVVLYGGGSGGDGYCELR